MTYDEAISKLDNPKDGEDYGVLMMVSKTIDKYILKSKYGLVVCTHDWPSPFSPNQFDIEATDYSVVKNIDKKW